MDFTKRMYALYNYARFFKVLFQSMLAENDNGVVNVLIPLVTSNSFHSFEKNILTPFSALFMRLVQ